jgi:hypothetical protein
MGFLAKAEKRGAVGQAPTTVNSSPITKPKSSHRFSETFGREQWFDSGRRTVDENSNETIRQISATNYASAFPLQIGRGEPLSEDMKVQNERRFGLDLSPIRIHQNTDSSNACKRFVAKGFCFGSQIAIPEGGEKRRIITHELVHYRQQISGDQRNDEIKEDEARDFERGIIRYDHFTYPNSWSPQLMLAPDEIVRIIIVGHQASFELDTGEVIQVRLWRQDFPPGSYRARIIDGHFGVSGRPSSERFDIDRRRRSLDPETLSRLRVLWERLVQSNRTVILEVDNQSSTNREEARPEPDTNAPDASTSSPTRGALPAIRVRSAAQIQELVRLGLLSSEDLSEEGEGQQAGSIVEFEQARSLMAALITAVGSREQPSERTGGRHVLDLARFLSENRENLRGRLGASSQGLEDETIRQIIAQYGEFIGGSDYPEREGASVEEYDPRRSEQWNSLQAWERQAWIRYIEQNERFIDTFGISIDDVSLSPEMIFRMALSMSPGHMPAGTRDEMARIMSSPLFWAGIYTSIVIYMALWTVPEPTFVRSAAIGITIGLLAVFSASEIYSLAMAWSRLRSDCESVRSYQDIERASERFGGVLGQIEGRILLTLILMLLGRLLPTPRPPAPGGPIGPHPVPVGATPGGDAATWSRAAQGIQVLSDGTIVVLSGSPAIATTTALAMSSDEREAPYIAPPEEQIRGAQGTEDIVVSREGGRRVNRINPDGREDNCIACVSALIRNLRSGRFSYSANDIEGGVAYTGRSRSIQMQRALDIISRSTGLTPLPGNQRFFLPDAPPGRYVIFLGRSRGAMDHVLYGEVSPNGSRFIINPQESGRPIIEINPIEAPTNQVELITLMRRVYARWNPRYVEYRLIEEF